MIKFSSIKWKNNNAIKTLKLLSLCALLFTEIHKRDAVSLSLKFCLVLKIKCEKSDSLKKERERRFHDTYRDMLPDNGFESRSVDSLKHPLEQQITLTIQSFDEVNFPRSSEMI